MEQKCNDSKNDEAMENHHSWNCLHLDSKQSYQQVIWRRNRLFLETHYRPFSRKKTNFSLIRERLVISIDGLLMRHLPKYTALPKDIEGECSPL